MDSLPQSARIEDWTAALRLIFQHLPAEQREQRCANVLHLLHQGEFSAEGLFVLRDARQLRGAVICLPVPGRSALVWPPGAVEDKRRQIEDALLGHVVAWLRGRGVRLAQTLLAPEEEELAAPLLRNGFSAITRLGYLRHDLNLPLDCLNVPVRLDYQAFHEDDVEFARTLERTYEGTLDCPEINGVRVVEDVLEGHRAQGKFDSQRWWLARAEGLPIGVVLMMESADSGNWEAAYLGVAPQARRRGFGREMMLHALCVARAEGARAVTLSVDARNQPAWKLYRGLGFEPFDQRLVYLAIFK